MNVLLTRPLIQVQALQLLVENARHQPLLFPTLIIESVAATTQKTNYDAVIFISANAVAYGLGVLQKLNYSQLFTVGPATANKLRECDISVDDFPKKNASSEALLALKSVAALHHKNILIFRGKGGRETLKQGLIKRHNQVAYIEVYQRITSKITPLHVRAMTQFLADKNGVISLTSVENLHALLTLAPIEMLKNYPVIVLSARIQRAAKLCGFSTIIIAPQPDNQGIIKALEDFNTLDK